jgi:hypothetical protein
MERKRKDRQNKGEREEGEREGQIKIRARVRQG